MTEAVTKIAQYLTSGMRYSQVPGQLAKDQIACENVLEAIERAVELIKSENVIDPELEHAKAIARLNDLYARSMAIQNYDNAGRIQKEITKLVMMAENRR